MLEARKCKRSCIIVYLCICLLCCRHSYSHCHCTPSLSEEFRFNAIWPATATKLSGFGAYL